MLLFSSRIFFLNGGRQTGKTVPRVAWIGSDMILEALAAQGIDRNRVLVTGDITNSKEEAYQIHALATEKGFETVGSISVPYHGGRMMPYMVAVMEERRYWLNYYMLTSPIVSWFMPILGSQGNSMTTCAGAAMSDAVKIEDHIARGWAADFGKVLHYLANRYTVVAKQQLGYIG